MLIKKRLLAEVADLMHLGAIVFFERLQHPAFQRCANRKPVNVSSVHNFLRQELILSSRDGS
jgi:hypothetical protein